MIPPMPWQALVAALILFTGLITLANCTSPPPSSIVVTAGVCWPPEGDAAYSEYQRVCGDHGVNCPDITEWRARLRVLHNMIPTCGAEKQ